jgi:hypothetical protein
MGWKIELIQSRGIIRLIMSGSITFPDVARLRSEAADLAKAHSVCKFVSDYRNASLDVSTFDIYRLPDDLARIGFSRKHKLAMVCPASAANRADFAFFETVAVNRGLQVRLFTDDGAAMTWLDADE